MMISKGNFGLARCSVLFVCLLSLDWVTAGATAVLCRGPPGLGFRRIYCSPSKKLRDVSRAQKHFSKQQRALVETVAADQILEMSSNDAQKGRKADSGEVCPRGSRPILGRLLDVVPQASSTGPSGLAHEKEDKVEASLSSQVAELLHNVVATVRAFNGPLANHLARLDVGIDAWPTLRLLLQLVTLCRGCRRHGRKYFVIVA